MALWPNSIFILEEIPGAAAYWPIPAVKAHYWLGVAYELQGKKNKSIKEFRKFIEIWKDADFKSPELNDAKARILKLTASDNAFRQNN